MVAVAVVVVNVEVDVVAVSDVTVAAVGLSAVEKANAPALPCRRPR